MERTAHSLLMQLSQEIKVKRDLRNEMDKMCDRAVAAHDFDQANIYEQHSKKLYEEEQRLNIAYDVIKERAR